MNPERLTLMRADNPKIKSEVTVIPKGIVLGSGKEADVHLVDVISDAAPYTSISLARKVYKSGNQIATKEQIKANHRRVKNAELPTLHTLRVPKYGEDYFMTDLTDGGNNVVLSWREASDSTFVQGLYEERPNQMSAFANEVPVYTAEVNAQTIAYGEKSATAHLEVTDDAWAAVIKPDGTYDILIVDYGNIKYTGSVPFGLKPARGITLAESNIKNFHYFKERISKAQEAGIK